MSAKEPYIPGCKATALRWWGYHPDVNKTWQATDKIKYVCWNVLNGRRVWYVQLDGSPMYTGEYGGIRYVMGIGNHDTFYACNNVHYHTAWWSNLFKSYGPGFGEDGTLPGPAHRPKKEEPAPEIKRVIVPAVDKVRMAEAFMSMIKRQGVTVNKWYDVGCALYTVFKGNQRGLELWQEWTGLDMRYKDVVKSVGLNHSFLDALIGEYADDDGLYRQRCAELYPDLDEGNLLTEKTLAWYARMDTPEQYNAWHAGWCNEAIKKVATKEVDDMALAAYRVLWLEYMYGDVPGAKAGWWHFDGRWTHDEKDEKVGDALIGDFKSRVVPMIAHYVADQEAKLITLDERSRRLAEAVIKILGEMQTKLKEDSFSKKVRTRLHQHEYFGRPFENTIASVMDSNYRYMGHRNGVVWETTLEEIKRKCDRWLITRPAKPEDYISMSTGVDFTTEKSWEDPDVQYIVKHFERMLSPECTRFYWKYIASSISGDQIKRHLIEIGETHSGKSMTHSLIDATEGDYVTTIGTSVLCRREMQKPSGGANPEMMQMVDRRLIMFREPLVGETWASAVFNGIGSGDKCYIRPLFGMGGVFRIAGKVLLSANNYPRFDAFGDEIKQRILFLLFLSKFGYDAPPDAKTQDEKRHYPRDDGYEKKLLKRKGAFAWILYQMYEEYKEDGKLIVPEEVQRATDEYWNAADPYNIFCVHNINPIPVQGANLPCWTVCEKFKMFWKGLGYHMLPPDNFTIIENFSRRIGKQQNGYWPNIDWKR